MRWLLAAILVCSACSPDSPRLATEPARALYSDAQLYGLRFKGVGLGMSPAEICSTLTGQGYIRRPQDRAGDPCRADRLKPESSDDYFGEAVFRDFRDPRRSPTDSVHHIAVTYRGAGPSLRATSIRAHTREPDRAAELIAATISEWGRPTHFENHAYAILNYAGAAALADPMNIHAFGSCRFNAGCEYQKDKTDCGAVLRAFARPRAQVTIYDWGRSIELDDDRPYVADLKASGWFERRAWEKPAACPVYQVH